MKIRTTLEPWACNISVQITKTEPREGGRFVTFVPVIEWREVESDCCVLDTNGHLSQKDAQVLMDDLWRCGLRPTEGRGSAGAMSATQRHLEDMRKIAFNKLEIEQ